MSLNKNIFVLCDICKWMLYIFRVGDLKVHRMGVQGRVQVNLIASPVWSVLYRLALLLQEETDNVTESCRHCVASESQTIVALASARLLQKRASFEARQPIAY